MCYLVKGECWKVLNLSVSVYVSVMRFLLIIHTVYFIISFFIFCYSLHY